MYNLDNIDKIPDNELQFIITNQLCLDSLKMECERNLFLMLHIIRNQKIKQKKMIKGI